MGCGTGVKQAVIMFLLIPTWLMGSSFKMGTLLIIVTTRGMTKIINKHYTKCNLLVPHTWFTHYLNLPQPVDFFVTLFGGPWHLGQQHLYVKENDTHVLYTQNMQFTQNSKIQNHKHILRYAICTGPQHHHWNDKENKNFITTGMDKHTYTEILFFYRCTMIKKQNDSTHLLTTIRLPTLQNKTPYVR